MDPVDKVPFYKTPWFWGVVGVTAIVGVGAVYNKVVYNDWKCMFRRCVVVKNLAARR